MQWRGNGGCDWRWIWRSHCCRLRRLRSYRCSSLGCGGRFVIFTLNNRDDRSDFYAVGAFGNQQLCNHTFVDRLKFHCRLVGFDLCDQIT